MKRMVKMKPRVKEKVMGRPLKSTEGVDEATLRKRENDRRQKQRKKAATLRAKISMDTSFRWPLAVTKQGHFTNCRPFITPGSGKRTISTGGDSCGREGGQVSISFISVNAPLIAQWSRRQAIPFLYDTTSDVNVTLLVLDVVNRGASNGACAGLALVLLLGYSLVDHEVAITGYLDLRGRMKMVGDVKEKIQHGRDKKVCFMIVPMTNYEQLNAVVWENKEDEEYMKQSVHGASDFVDVMQLAVKDFHRVDGMVEALDGPQVGVGYCVGLVDDGVGVIEIQGSWTYPGNRELIMTGNPSTVSQDAIRNMEDLICVSLPSIAEGLPEALQPAEGGELCLMKDGHDLHIHIEHGFQEIRPAYQMAAIYVALVSLMIGHRPREDTLIFGSVTCSLGVFSGRWEVEEIHVSRWASVGYRRAILGKGIKVSDEARATAGVIQGDGEPLMVLITRDYILDAFPLCFSW